MFGRFIKLALGLACSASFAYAAPTKDYGAIQSLSIHVQPTDSAESSITLDGGDARQQVLVTAKYSGGFVEDLTHKASYESSPADVLEVKEGLVVPRKNGEATVTAKTDAGISGSLKITVKNFEHSRPINFGNQIVPIFTKAGCNGGGCHGKSSGQNGFKLSLLGFEPGEDYEFLVKEGKGRRLFPAAPDRSLLMLKATAALPHGGGKRLDEQSDDYKLLIHWVSQGMPYGDKNDPVVDSIEVFPRERTMRLGGEQQLVVMAHYTDGRLEDVTRSALYEPNDKNMAKTDATGRVTVFEQPGDVAVMIRYQAKVAVFRASLPLGAPVENLPKPNNFIDQLVFKKLQTLGLPPSELCDDSTFLRRSAIDIAGRLPTPAETKKFLADSNPQKREKWVDKLLNSPSYAEYFANKWSSLLRNKRTDAIQARGTFGFYNWMRDSFIENKPYDQFVREILTATGDMTENPPVAWYRQVNNPNMQLEDSAQLFLGLRLQCAQCHHHPFEKWSQNDYYSLAAIFSKVSKKPGSKPGEDVVIHTRGMSTATNKKTKQPVKPAALGTAFASLGPDDDPRSAYADWMASKDNPFFARSLVNRYWKHFFNRGIVDPEDDMRETNPPTNPELLEAASKYFVESGFDLKQLIRAICTSKTYQLSSLPNDYNKVDKQHYSRYFPKRLTAEVLYDAVNDALHTESHFDGLPVGTRATELPDNSFNAASYFLTVFGRPDASSSCECERSQDASLAQSLHLLNSKEIQDKLSSDSGRAALLAKETAESEDDKLRDVYFLAFSRAPRDEELGFAKAYIEKKLATADDKNKATLKRQAYEDVLWAIINTKEFLFNH